MSGYLESQLIILCLSIIYAYGIFLPAASGQLNLGAAAVHHAGCLCQRLDQPSSDGLGLPLPISLLLAVLFTGADQFRNCVPDPANARRLHGAGNICVRGGRLGPDH